MQESVICIECLISSGVSRGFSPAGCVPELGVGLRSLENGVGGLERLHPPRGVSVAPGQPRGGCSEGLFGVFSSQAAPFSCVRFSS